MTRKPPQTIISRLHALAELVPAFEAPGFRFGAWAPGSGDPHEVTYYETGPTGRLLLETCYSMGWVMDDFDWPTWMQTDEAIHLRNDLDSLAQATPEQLAHLLTVMIRQDRFVEGSLGAHAESGLLVSVLRRAAVLEAELSSHRR